MFFCIFFTFIHELQIQDYVVKIFSIHAYIRFTTLKVKKNRKKMKPSKQFLILQTFIFCFIKIAFRDTKSYS